MSTTAEIQEKIRDTLAADVEFVNWCLETIGKAPTIQIDFDERAETPDALFPIVGILTVTHDGTIQQRNNLWQVYMSAGVLNEELITATAGSGATTRTYAGRLQAEGLREQATAALYRAVPGFGKVSISSKELRNTFHPRFYSPFIVSIEERI